MRALELTRRRLATRLLSEADRCLGRLRQGLGDAHRVVNFLRGHLEFRPRADDIFIVSYPRSGTTLMQMLLYQLTSDGELDFAHISEVSPWFERSLALGTRRATDFEALPSPRIFKSHLPATWVPEGVRCLYVLRDGMDVAHSYFHFYRAYLGFRGDFSEFFGRFLRGELQYRSWFDHVAGWSERREAQEVLFCHFRDLTEDPDACIERIASFCGLELDAERRRRARERSSFAYMKAHEERFDHATRVLLDRGLSKRSFIRRGRSQVGRRVLSAAQQRLFHKRQALAPGEVTGLSGLADFLH